MQKNEKVIDSVRLHAQEREALLDALDKSTGGAASSSRRVTRRWRYRNRIVVAINQAGSVQSYFVTPRNISTTGVAFVHGGYVHPGSKIAVALRNRDEKLCAHQGRVVRCVHVQGRLHEIGVEFASQINPKDFVPPGDEPAFNVERVQIESLHGRVLIVEDSRADQRLMAFHLRGSQLELVYSLDAGSAFETVDNSIDLVFLDTTLPDKSGMDALTELRAKGYAGPIIALLPAQDRATRASFLEAGANEVLAKPIGPELLRQAAAEFLIAGGCESESSSMLYSSINDSRMRELVEMYVKDCRRIGEEIADSVESGDAQKVRRAIEQLVGSAAGHGFDSIDRLARAAITTLDESPKLDQASAAIQAVINGCRRAAVRMHDDESESHAA